MLRVSVMLLSLRKKRPTSRMGAAFSHFSTGEVIMHPLVLV